MACRSVLWLFARLAKQWCLTWNGLGRSSSRFRLRGLHPRSSRRFPSLPPKWSVGRLETILGGHEFTDTILLGTALTHTTSSANELTPDFQRLVCLGSATAELLVTHILFENATFSTAATVNRDEVAKASTYAVGLSSLQVARKRPLPASSGCSEDAKKLSMQIDNQEMCHGYLKG